MAEWVEKPVDRETVEALVAAGYPRLLARLLASRGVTADSADEYFSPSWKRLSPADALPGITTAAAEIFKAIEANKRIVVFGDYDCDGFCSTSIVVRTVKALGGDAVPFIPRRTAEGYGMSSASVSRMLKEIPDIGLIVTVDNGTGSEREICDLKARGIPVIVTDHHLPGDELPTSAIIYVNPKVPETQTPERLQSLCGAGVAYFLSNALVSLAREVRGDPSLAKGLSGILFTLAGLATVTDIMPIRGENRILVAQALKNFQRWAPVGLLELYARAARTGASALGTKDFGFTLGPRINSCGRLGDGHEALELLLSSDRERARQLALEVDRYNVERKSIEQGMTERAMERVVPGAAGQVIDLGESGPLVKPGVAGIVAARVLERLAAERGDLGVPVCVLVNGKGSCRAPEGYNVRDALEACSEALTHFGGHAGAAGLGVKEGQMDRLRELFCQACAIQYEKLPEEVRSAMPIDAWVEPEDLTLELAEKVAAMEPFGEGNPEPVFALRGVPLAELRPMRNNSKHLQVLVGGKTPLRGVWWGHGDEADSLRAGASNLKDVLFSLEISNFGEPHVEIRVRDIR